MKQQTLCSAILAATTAYGGSEESERVEPTSKRTIVAPRQRERAVASANLNFVSLRRRVRNPRPVTFTR